jgi:hypothetical protein
MPAFRGHWFSEFLPIAQCDLRASLKANHICNAGTCRWRHTRGQHVAVSIEGSDSDSASEKAIRLTQQVKNLLETTETQPESKTQAGQNLQE